MVEVTEEIIAQLRDRPHEVYVGVARPNHQLHVGDVQPRGLRYAEFLCTPVGLIRRGEMGFIQGSPETASRDVRSIATSRGYVPQSAKQ
jgi:hypothetical protein